MNQFSSRYQKLGNSDLIKIIESPSDYQPEAIEAANDEFAIRQLSNEDLLSAPEENDARAHEQPLKSDRVKALESKAKDIVYNIAGNVNPVQPGKSSTPKAILWISILMVLLFLYQLYTQFGLLRYMLLTDAANWDFSMAIYFIRPLAIMPVATLLFMLGKKLGWILLCAYFISLLINTFCLLYFPDNKIDRLAPRTPSDLLIGWLVFICGCFYFMFKADVRKFHGISWQNIITALILGMLLSIATVI